MSTDQAVNTLQKIKEHYDAIPSPKYRNADLPSLLNMFEQLQGLKDVLGHEQTYENLINAMSQIIAKLSKSKTVSKDSIWSNYSERATNKVIPPIVKGKVHSWPVEWMDKWGNTCSVSNGYWGAKQHIVMDVIGYMYLLKEGGDCLPKNAAPLFNDLFEVQQREGQLNGQLSTMPPSGKIYYIRFTDNDFRRFTGLKMNSTEIKTLLLETSRVEFKLTFPVRLKSTGDKENTHRMNYFSRFFEFGYEDLLVKKNGVVLSRRYTIYFNTSLGELFVSNLLAKYNSPIDNRFYLLPDSAQFFYRRALMHNNYKRIEFNLATIASYAGLSDSNPWNLAVTVETGVFKPLMDFGYISSFEKSGDDAKAIKFIVKRSSPEQ